ncbi:hypothetical protein [Halorubrum sp. 48-1-W]|uniref:hypothetical protein n=1 Tax=Halorubrum sp. 48-1-W TaxID=2249761 RepID=UPI00130091B8|nr:hypothetical protein [Halorubrum sp. 48-1-W]
MRGFENPEDVWVVLVVEGIEDIPLPLEVTRIAELVDAEALRTGEVFEVDTTDRRDITTLTRRNVGGFGKRGLDPSVETRVVRGRDYDTVGRPSEEFGGDSTEILVHTSGNCEEVAIVVDGSVSADLPRVTSDEPLLVVVEPSASPEAFDGGVKVVVRAVLEVAGDSRVEAHAGWGIGDGGELRRASWRKIRADCSSQLDMVNFSIGIDAVLVADVGESTFLVADGLDDKGLGEERREFAKEVLGVLTGVVPKEFLGFVVDDDLAFVFIEIVVEALEDGLANGRPMRRGERGISVEREVRRVCLAGIGIAFGNRNLHHDVVE